jgi:1-acyl-sn-glycerol-3-phosphate acyltransferase
MPAERDAAPVDHALAAMVSALVPPDRRRGIEGARLADLGFDSLACAELAIAVEERFGVRLVDGDFSDRATVSDLAATVRRTMPLRPRIRRGFGGFQATAKTIVGGAIRWYCRLEVIGWANVPLSGPAVLAANHRSMWDIPVHVVACPRPVMFMAKRELFGDPVRRWLWHILGGFAVRRDIADVRAIDTALALLERGDIVGVYPEGTRSKTGEMLPFLRGAAWLALRTGAPLVPCGLRGTGVEGAGVGQNLRRKRVRVSFGRAIRVDPEPDPATRKVKAESLTDQLLEGIRHLLA